MIFDWMAASEEVSCATANPVAANRKVSKRLMFFTGQSSWTQYRAIGRKVAVILRRCSTEVTGLQRDEESDRHGPAAGRRWEHRDGAAGPQAGVAGLFASWQSGASACREPAGKEATAEGSVLLSIQASLAILPALWKPRPRFVSAPPDGPTRTGRACSIRRRCSARRSMRSNTWPIFSMWSRSILR